MWGSGVVIIICKKTIKCIEKIVKSNYTIDVDKSIAYFVNMWAGRKTQVQPIWRGDSSPYLLRRIHEEIKYFR